jgi:hypothetical protein
MKLLFLKKIKCGRKLSICKKDKRWNKVDSKKIAFILCVNNMELYNIAKEHIYKLLIPDGVKVEIIRILNAGSIFKGYNTGMKMTDAKYKVYLHQDTYIKNEKFIYDILKIFNSDEKIGLLGVVGTKKLNSTGVWYNSEYKCGEVYDSHTGRIGLIRFQQISGDFEVVDAVDGLIMVTQHDIPWREDVFKGWHFYDASQCFEMRRNGYFVVVPKQDKIWCLHDCGIVSLKGFEENQKVFLNEYAKEIN